MSESRERLDSLSPEQKRRLLAELLQKEAQEPTSYPLSFGQERLWFLEQLHPGTAVYHQPIALRLSGVLNVPALEQSLEAIVQRHDSLRTTFSVVDGQAQQVVGPMRPIAMARIDLQHRPTAEADAQRWMSKDAQQPFDLNQGPLWRFSLIKLAAEDHLLLLVIHHFIFDGWSYDIFLREFAAFYTAATTGPPATLSPLPLRYGVVAVWQRRWIQSEAAKAQFQYWTRQLGGSLPVLVLPTDRPRPPVQTTNGTQHVFQLSPSLSAALHALAQRSGVTLFMVLLAAFKALLYRYTQEDDLIVGTPMAGRTRAEVEELIGCFVNTLVLRTNMGGNPSFQELLQRVREMTLNAYEHQELPFEHLVEALQPQRHLSHHPLFQIMFVFQNTLLRPLQLPELNIQTKTVSNGTAKFDVTLSLRETESGLRAVLEYNTDIFESTTMVRLCRHYQRLLEDIVAHPSKPLAALSLLTASEQHQVLVEWNPPIETAVVSTAPLIHQRFERQVRLTPDAIAVTDGESHITYDTLNQRANRLAHYLRHIGIGVEHCVAICLERSLDLVVGMLGILKAGGAYVPLEPTYPAERLSFMLTDSRSRALLTEHQFLNKFSSYEAHTICLDQVWRAIEPHSPENLDGLGRADQLAYVIYTSGSSGAPKGVLVEHRQVTRLFDATYPWFHWHPQDVWTQFHAAAFDFSVWELWGALLYGGRLVMVPYWMSRSPDAFYALLCREQVTVLNQTPSAFQHLIPVATASSTNKAVALRLVIFGGEALDITSLSTWFERHGDEQPQLINMYGITETTVHVTYAPLAHRGLSNPSQNTIGRPIPDLQVYLLDVHQTLVPVGVPGEIYVGGAGLARGYLNQPKLTAERFVPNPFSAAPGARLYKTGDLARYLPSGELGYLGRCDQQVKLRGFRIELGEIETALAQHPAIREAVVRPRQETADNRHLVAYIVVDREPAPNISELHRFLGRTLPDYMLPAAYVPLTSLPLTSNGKLDLQALPTPGTARPSLDVGWVKARQGKEEMIADLWATLLGLEQIGIHDNFFELGGHSLLAVQVITRLRDMLQVDVPLQTLFDTPTVAGLAAATAIVQQSIRGTIVTPIRPAPRDDRALPVSMAQAQLWTLDQLLPSTPLANIPTAIRMTGQLEPAILERCINELVQRHEVLRTTFKAVAGKPVQVIAPARRFHLKTSDLQKQSPADRKREVDRLMREVALEPFNLETGPLMRLCLLSLAEQEYLLLLTMHHMIGDAWSLNVWMRELAILYNAFTHGNPSPLPPLPIQYVDFTHWQHRLIQSEYGETLRAYWREQLSSPLPKVALPTDRPRVSTLNFRTARQTFEISQDRLEALEQLGRQAGNTRFMTLFAAFNVWLYNATGQEDLCVATLVANRGHRETEGLIGLLMNTVLLRTDLKGDPTLRQILERVRATALGAYDHQDLPFEALIQMLGEEHQRPRDSLCQIMFVLQPAIGLTQEVSTLAFGQAEASKRIADLGFAMTTFDLVMVLREQPQGLTGSCIYKTHLFDTTTVEQMMELFQVVLMHFTLQPDQFLSSLKEIL